MFPYKSQRKTSRLLIAALLLLLMAFSYPQQSQNIAVYIISDSTAATKRVAQYPQAGWGMPFPYFFNETVRVENHAVGGISTRTFLAENRWQPVYTKLQPGDFVLIQFGHNDEVKTKKSYTPETEFVANLVKFISECCAKKAIPVLITPVARRVFLANGKLKNTHEIYSPLVRQVAREQKVPLIDLDKSSTALIEELGPEKSKFLFNHLTPGEHPNFPAGVQDNTHFNELGARKIAQLILKEIKEQKLALADRIIVPEK